MARKYLTFSLLATTIVLLLVPTVRAISQSITVQAGQEKTVPLSLAVDDHVKMAFIVSGSIGQPNILDFYITDCYGNVMKDFGVAGEVNYAFVCSQEGEYNLHFSNVVSEGDKLVTLQYVVQHYILGMEQNLFMTLIIAVLCVGLVAGVIRLAKRL